jgi:isopenicillin N synthase-like dioxygenase
MHNERDWREQLHLGRERAAAGATPVFRRLEGPNLWPADPAWRRVIAGYGDAVTALGEAILGAAARALRLDDDPFAGVGRDGYLVMKLIGYHPQASAASVRPGVAPHVDFSWLTLTLQDSPGLEVRAPGGGWTLIAPRSGTLWVHAGELLEHATRGRYRAAPHRVINQSIERTRVSIPIFLNPPLDAYVPVLVAQDMDDGEPDGEHVHRVLLPDAPAAPFHFGESEWRRKGLGGWCAVCAPPAAGEPGA